MPKAVLTPMPERLKAAAREVADAQTALRLALRRRDRIVVEAIDEEGLSHREVGKLAGVTGPRITAILAGSHDDEDDE